MHKESCAFSEARGDYMKNELLQEDIYADIRKPKQNVTFFLLAQHQSLRCLELHDCCPPPLDVQLLQRSFGTFSSVAGQPIRKPSWCAVRPADPDPVAALIFISGL